MVAMPYMAQNEEILEKDTPLVPFLALLLYQWTGSFNTKLQGPYVHQGLQKHGTHSAPRVILHIL